MYGIFTLPETNIAPKKGLLQSNHWLSGDMLVAGSVLTFLGLKKISMGKPSRCNNFSNGSALYNIWGDDFALWSLEFLQRKKVLGGHTEPCPRVPWWWPFRGDPPHRCWAGGRVDDWCLWLGFFYRTKITMNFLGLQKSRKGQGLNWCSSLSWYVFISTIYKGNLKMTQFVCCPTFNVGLDPSFF